MIGEGFEQEGKYFNRLIRWTRQRIEFEGVPKHAAILLREWGMLHASTVDTPLTREGQDTAGMGDDLDEGTARSARRSIARINYMAQDRPDLGAAARVLSQHMAQPKSGVIPVLKRVLRYLRKYPRGILKVTGVVEWIIEVFTDSDWAGDVASRRSCSGGGLMIDSNLVHHWSKLQANVALSSGEAELNAAVKGISEAIGMAELVKEVAGVEPRIRLHTDANACRGMLLRQGAGKVKHLSMKQFWVQGAIQAYGIEVMKIARSLNFADVLTHSVGREDLQKGMDAMGFLRG